MTSMPAYEKNHCDPCGGERLFRYIGARTMPDGTHYMYECLDCVMRFPERDPQPLDPFKREGASTLMWSERLPEAP